MREVTLWNPFIELTRRHRNINELFDLPFKAGRKETNLFRQWPALDSYEKDGQYFVRLDLPGVDPKEVEVIAEGNSLTIKGERKNVKEVEEENYSYRETSAGRFERRLALPKGVDADKIAARYDQGVLEISVPLPVQLVSKKVPVQIEDGHDKAH